jgi:hypothetical protein
LSGRAPREKLEPLSNVRRPVGDPPAERCWLSLWTDARCRASPLSDLLPIVQIIDERDTDYFGALAPQAGRRHMATRD